MVPVLHRLPQSRFRQSLQATGEHGEQQIFAQGQEARVSSGSSSGFLPDKPIARQSVSIH